MATSLVSTGVQFPDSTIQTTAAGASGLTLLSTVTASGASQADFTGLSSTAYMYYQLIGKNILPSTQMTLELLVSTNNGSSFVTTGYSNYFGGFGTASYDGGRQLSAAVIAIAGIHNTSWRGNIVINLFPNASGGYFSMNALNFGTADYFSTITGGITGGGNNASTTAVNAVRLRPSTGTFSGTFKLYGVAA